MQKFTSNLKLKELVKCNGAFGRAQGGGMRVEMEIRPRIAMTTLTEKGEIHGRLTNIKLKSAVCLRAIFER